jgi:CBS domain-containing protein
MKQTTVKDLMVPLSEFATVSQEATLYQAISALEQARKEYNQRKVPYRAILVLDQNDQVVGKLSELDVLRGLEPRYKDLGDLRSTSISGLSPELLKSMLENFRLWQRPLADICGKAADIVVKDIGYTPIEDKCVEEDATLDEAVHLLIVGQHQNLLVTRGKAKEIVGVLRLSDIFNKVCEMIQTCKP